MYKIYIYADLGFTKTRQKWYKNSLPDDTPILSQEIDGVFNGERSTLTVKTSTEKFFTVINTAKNVIVAQEKRRSQWFFITRAEQVTRDSVTLYLEKDIFHTYFNNTFPATVSGWISRGNIIADGVKTRRGAGITPSLSEISKAYSMFEETTSLDVETICVAVFKTNSGYIICAPKSTPFISGTVDKRRYGIRTASYMSQITNIRDTATLTSQKCEVAFMWVIPKVWHDAMSVAKDVDYQINDGSANWWDTFALANVTNIDGRINGITRDESAQIGYKELGTPFTRVVLDETYETFYDFKIRITTTAFSLNIALVYSNKSVDLTQDFAFPFTINTAQREYNEYAAYRTLERWGAALSFLNSQTRKKGSYDRVNDFMSVGEKITQWQQRELQQELTYSTVAGSGSAREVFFVDNSNGFGLYITPPADNFKAKLCNYVLRDATGEYTLNGRENISQHLPTGANNVAFFKFENAKVTGATQTAAEELKAMFESGIFITYEKTT